MPRSPGRRTVAAYDDSAGIHVVSRAGGDGRLLVAGTSTGLAWSPDLNAVAFVGGGGPTLVTVDGRERTVFPASPHDEEAELGIGWTAVRRGDRYRAPESLTPLLEVSARELRAHVPIGALSADGDRVAYVLCPHVLGVWRPGDPQQIVLGEATVEACRPSRFPEAPARKTYDLALAGDRLAYVVRGGGLEARWALMLARLGGGTERTAIVPGPACCNDGPFLPPLGDVVGGGSTLVYGAWSDSAPESIRRIDGETPVEIARRPDGIQPLAVDDGRIVARRSDGSLELLGRDGGLLRTFEGPALAAALAGDDLVVLVGGELRDYSASTGERLRTWPLPDVPSSGPCRLPSCPGIRLTLLGAARGLALYKLDGAVHLLRLRDGADVTIPFALSAALTDAGLFTTFAGVEPWPGGIRFVPFADLPLR
jgi:hypothetical protein